MTIPNFKIICSDKLMSELEDHCFSETKVEVGGFLIGRINGATAEVTKVVRAKHSVGKSTQLTFTHDTWNALHSEMDEADGTLIGWYHSHPNFGVFLSEHDQFIQQNFFKQEGNITIVVDPVRGRRGWFYSSAGKIVKFEKEVDTTKARLGKSATNSDENIEAVMGKSNQGVTMGKVVLVSAITSILGAFLGFGLSSSSGNSSGSQDQINMLNAQVAQIIGILEKNNLTGYVVPTVSASPSSTKKAATTKPTTKATSKGTSKPANSDSTTAVIKPIFGKSCDPLKDAKTTELICISAGGSKTKGTWQKLPAQAPAASDSKTAGK